MQKIVLSLAFAFSISAGLYGQASVNPNNGNRGQSLPIIISGQSGGFSNQGTSLLVLAQGSYVLSSGVTNAQINNVAILGSNTISADLSIPSNAPLGYYDLFVVAGTYTGQPQAFMVNQGTPTPMTINPGGGKPGESLSNVVVSVPGASFKTATSGTPKAWLSYNGEILNSFSNVVVTGPTSFSADLNIPAAATQALWDLNVYHETTTQMFQRSALFDINQSFDIPELQNDFELSVYPNPGQDLVRLKFESQLSGELQFQLLDLSGRQMELPEAKLNRATGEATLSLDQLPKGTYVIQMLVDGELKANRIWIKA